MRASDLHGRRAVPSRRTCLTGFLRRGTLPVAASWAACQSKRNLHLVTCSAPAGGLVGSVDRDEVQMLLCTSGQGLGHPEAEHSGRSCTACCEQCGPESAQHGCRLHAARFVLLPEDQKHAS